MLKSTYLKNRDKFELRYLLTVMNNGHDRTASVPIDSLKKGIRHFDFFLMIYTADRQVLRLTKNKGVIWNAPSINGSGSHITIDLNSSSKIDSWKHFFNQVHKRYLPLAEFQNKYSIVA